MVVRHLLSNYCLLKECCSNATNLCRSRDPQRTLQRLQLLFHEPPDRLSEHVVLAREDASGADVHHGGSLDGGRPQRLLQVVDLSLQSSLPGRRGGAESPHTRPHHCPAPAQHPAAPLCLNLVLLCPAIQLLHPADVGKGYGITVEG